MQKKEKKVIIIRKNAGGVVNAGASVESAGRQVESAGVQKIKLPEDFLRELDGKSTEYGFMQEI